MRRNFFICLLLAGITLAIYWPARNYDIVYFDDQLFVTDNPETAAGLNWHSFVWAMTSITAGNWHPVTSFSFVLTHQFFGTNPGAEHLVNIFFHAANAVLLFLVLLQMTGATWRSTMVAAIFAWHPLRVESVAWISERKDVLFAFFMLLALLCYARFAQKRSKAKFEPQVFAIQPWRRDYCLALMFFALGFMSKAMIVSLPFLFLLLDYWPLQRTTNGEFRTTNLKPLLLEKIPFFVLAIFFSALTFWIQKNHDAYVTWERLGLMDRTGHAILSYVQYLSKLFWPANLAVFYPFPRTQDVLEIWLAGLLLLAISAFCVCQIFRRPYLAVGWFWYLGTAVPIIGLVQVGGQAMADRYTYLPLIGPVISLVWLISDWVKSNPFRKFLIAPMTIILLATCVILTRRQLQFWQNTVNLFEHTIAVTPENGPAQSLLAVGLEREGRLDEAMLHYRIAGAIIPQNYRVYFRLGECFKNQGRWELATQELNTAITVAAANPDVYIVHLSLADALSHLGRNEEAMSHLNEALRIKPDSMVTLNDLAWLLATCPDANIRDGARAVQLAERACELTDYQRAIYIGTLAAAYAEAGRFDDAIATAQKACGLAQESGRQRLLQKNQELLELYRAHKPYHETAEKLVPDAK